MHSIEIWRGRKLIGGVYGLVLGKVFFAESMFHSETNASKIALIWLLSKLKSLKFEIFDTQYLNNHIKNLGGIEIDNLSFQRLLSKNINKKTYFLGVNSENSSDCNILLSFLHEMREIS